MKAKYLSSILVLFLLTLAFDCVAPTAPLVIRVILINNLNSSKIQYEVKACGKARRKLWKVAHGRLKLD